MTDLSIIQLLYRPTHNPVIMQTYYYMGLCVLDNND